jgi:hypothetical protein
MKAARRKGAPQIPRPSANARDDKARDDKGGSGYSINSPRIEWSGPLGAVDIHLPIQFNRAPRWTTTLPFVIPSEANLPVGS